MKLSKSARAKYLVTQKNVPVKVAAAKVGCSYQTVFQIMNIDKIRKRLNKSRAVNWAMKRKSQTWIANKVGMTNTSVHNVLIAIMGKKKFCQYKLSKKVK